MDKGTSNHLQRMPPEQADPRGTKTKRSYQRAGSFQQSVCPPFAACQCSPTKPKEGFSKGQCDHKSPMCTTQVSTDSPELDGTTAI